MERARRSSFLGEGCGWEESWDLVKVRGGRGGGKVGVVGVGVYLGGWGIGLGLGDFYGNLEGLYYGRNLEGCVDNLREWV